MAVGLVNQGNPTDGDVYSLCDIKLRQYPRPNPLPRFSTRFPFKRNHTYEGKRREWIYWQYPASQIPLDKYKKFECVILNKYFYPFPMPEHRYDVLTKIMIAFFILDDHTEESWGDAARDSIKVNLVWQQFSHMFDNLNGKSYVSMVNWKSYVVASYPLFEDVYKTYKDSDQRKRYMKVWQDWAQGNCQETSALNMGRLLSLDEYLQIREKSIAFCCSYQLIEYAYDICLSETEWSAIDFQALMFMCCRHSLFVNDTLSFDKELLGEHGRLNRVFNSVAIIVLNDKCSIQQALDKVIAMVIELENNIISMMTKIINKDIGKEMNKFIYYLMYIVGAQYRSSSVWDRYNRYNMP